MIMERAYYDDGDNIPSFGVAESKTKGDGIWCPDCLKDGRYMWLDFAAKTDGLEFYAMCPVHRVPVVRERD